MIPAGTPIEIHFNKKIKRGSFVILPEVAVDLRVRLLDESGKEVKGDRGSYQACEGRLLHIEARLIPQQGSGPTSFANAAVTFSYGDLKSKTLSFDSTTNAFIGAATVVPGNRHFAVRAEYEGYINISDSRVITGASCTPILVSLVAEQNGKRVQQWSVDACGFAASKEPLELYPVFGPNGRKLLPQEIKDWQATLTPPEGMKAVLQPTPMADGWILLPGYSFFTPCFTPTGNFPLQVSINGILSKLPPGVTKDKAFHLTVKGKPVRPIDQVRPVSYAIEIRNPGWFNRCWRLIAGILGLVLFVWWLWGIITKPRFAKGSMIEFVRKGAGRTDDYERLPGPWYKRWLIPYSRESKMVDGLIFKAHSSPLNVYLAEKSVLQLGSDLYINGLAKRPPFDRDEVIGAITRVEYRQPGSSTTYKYVRSNQ